MLNQGRNPDDGSSNHVSSAKDSGAHSLYATVKPDITEDQALAALQRSDVTSEEIAELARNTATMKSRKVLYALAAHPRTPRHLSLPLLRRMFTFDLMKVSLAPAVAADLKRVAEDQILIRLESLPAGERTSLARRSSGRVAAVLLQDSDSRVITAALDNSRLTEQSVTAELSKPDTPATLYEISSAHPKWSQRREVQIALLRSEKTPLDRAKELAKNFSPEVLREILPAAFVALAAKSYETE